MKPCTNCKTPLEDNAEYCYNCGTIFVQEQKPVQPVQPQPVQNDDDYVSTTLVTPTTEFEQLCREVENSQKAQTEPQKPTVNVSDNGIIPLGILGAFLFSIGGALIHFIMVQIGIIAGICGLITFALATIGYMLLGRTKNKASIVCLIVSIVLMFIMIFVGEWVGLTYVVYSEFKIMGVSFFQSFGMLAKMIETVPEVSDAFIKDLLTAYFFGIAATAGSVVNVIITRKNSKKQ